MPNLIVSVNMSKMKLLFDSINFLIGHKVESFIGYRVEALDDSRDVIVSNPIIKFNSAILLMR